MNKSNNFNLMTFLVFLFISICYLLIILVNKTCQLSLVWPYDGVCVCIVVLWISHVRQYIRHSLTKLSWNRSGIRRCTWIMPLSHRLRRATVFVWWWTRKTVPTSYTQGRLKESSTFAWASRIFRLTYRFAVLHYCWRKSDAAPQWHTMTGKTLRGQQWSKNSDSLIPRS